MEKGYIYKIYDNTNGNMYYGSTTQTLSMRMCGHRAKYKRFMEKGCGSNCRSFEILKNGDYSYSLVEEVEFENKLILRQRERYYIENNDCLNKCIPTRNKQEYYQDNKDKNKEYREANKDKIKEYRKQYLEANKEKIKEYKKQYREGNKDKIKEKIKEYREANKDKMKEYREANKDKIKEYKKEKIECECGCITRKDNMYRHIKTKKHLDNLKIRNTQ